MMLMQLENSPRAAALAFVLLLAAPGAGAQVKAGGVISDQRPGFPDSTQMAAAVVSVSRLRSPAAMALSGRAELGLSPEQIGHLEALVILEADSSRARSARLVEAMQRRLPTRSSGWGWSGPIDEAAVRAEACEQSKLQADMVIGLMRDRHAVGAVLTPAQHATLDQLQSRMMRGGARSPD